MSVEVGDLADDLARLQSLRCSLGAHLVLYRQAAGLSQPELSRMIGRTRSLVSKIENGVRGMPEQLWKITDDVCCAQGALIAEYTAFAQAERDYRARFRHVQRAEKQAQAQTALQAGHALVPAVRQSHQGEGHDLWSEMTRANGAVAEELRAVVTKLVRSIGRRDAMQTVGVILAIVGLPGLDPDEHMRVAQALDSPARVDAQVVENLAVTLAYCKRQEDKLGPCEVLDTVVAQHGLVRRLLKGGCPDQLRRSLSLVDSTMAVTIGGYLVDMGRPAAASRYFGRARRAAHTAGNPVCAAYAAVNTSFAAFLRADTPTALDTAAAARSLAARTDDGRLKALAEQMAAAAYALDGQYRPCMAASSRAHDMLTTATVGSADSPAYWVHHGTIDSHRSTFLSLLGRPKEAVEAASNALARFDRTYVHGYALSEVRLGHALVLSAEITEAARVLGDAASHANLSPRLTADLHTARALMQPWENTPAVTTLDTILESCGLLPAHPAMTPGPGTRATTTV